MADADLLWAKWGDSGRDFYPLVAHLLDTAAVAEALISGWMPSGLMGRLAVLSEVEESEVARALVSAAALHDLGKASPVFQAQQGSQREQEFADHAERLRQAGFSMDGVTLRVLPEDERGMLRRHEMVSAALLSDVPHQAGAHGLPALVAGHHGRWQIPDAHEQKLLCSMLATLRSLPGWEEARGQVLEVLTQVAGVRLECPDLGAAKVPVSGLVCLADWLASDLAHRERYRLPSSDWGEFFAVRQRQAATHVERMLGAPPEHRSDIGGAFDFPLDRPAQRSMIGSAARGDRRLTVVAVPTGEGKTEAALAGWLLSSDEREGLYFALPTMATADVMFRRIDRMVARLEEGSPHRTFGSLLHGRSMLNAFYSQPEYDLAGQVDGCAAEGLVPGQWFQGRHRSLLAPVSVGTVDQLLSAVLQHRFSFMRLMAVSGKTVVLDEVHSYDPYMSHLLERFLEWAGAMGVNVVMLSATLPSSRLRAYLSKYAGCEAEVAAQYPAVFSVRHGEAEAAAEALGSSGRERTLSLEYVRSRSEVSPAAVARRAVEMAGADMGARVGIMVNTVSRCQEVARELAALASDEDVLVLHSRFTASDRSRLTEAAEKHFGRSRTAGPRFLISTQVAEQSMDLDFDVLISDMAPVASLLQRAGRVHRHERSRPKALASPCMVVLFAPPEKVTQWSFLPYSAAEIMSSWKALGAGGVAAVAVPDDVQRLVDAAEVSWADLSSGLEGPDASLVEAHLADGASRALKAAVRLVPSPKEVAAYPALSLERFGSGELDEQHFETRWSQDLRVDCLLVGPGDSCWQGDVPESPSRQDVMELLSCTVPVSGAAARAALDFGLRACPDGSEAHPLLRDLRVLHLEELPQFRYDPMVGLIFDGGVSGG